MHTTLGRAGGTRIARPGPVATARAPRSPPGSGRRCATTWNTGRPSSRTRPGWRPSAGRRGAPELLALLDAKVTDLGEYHRIDTRFHLGLASAGGNEVLAEAVTRARAEMFVAGNALWLGSDWSRVYPTDRDFGLALREEHEAIAFAVLAGDGAAAEAAMREHLRDAHRQFLTVLDQFAAHD
ncbi:FCD domain-containing protein [Streptomyces albulus]|nr:FCD domain-containing protein [Streptomyces noursei]